MNAPAQNLAPDTPLYLGLAGKYVVPTLVLHMVYGAINAWLIPRLTPAHDYSAEAGR